MTQLPNVAELTPPLAPRGGAAAAAGSLASESDVRTARPVAPWWRRWLWWGCYLLAWPATLALIVVAALRIFDHDATNFLTSFNAFTRYAYLPAYACLAWAAWQRRWVLALASLLVVTCHLRWIAPDFVRDSRFDEPAGTPASVSAAQHSRAVRIFFANVCSDNEDPAAFLDEIPRWDPDIVVFVEFYHPWEHVVSMHPALSPYQYGSGRTLPFMTEVAVFSKLPLEKPQQLWTAGRLNLPIDVRVDDTPLRLFCLHSPRPMWLPLHDYAGFWKKTIPQILSQPDPTIVLGDFNATQYSLVYQTLTAERFRSAHEDRGRGFATTWPNGMEPLPPIRIDQALLSPHVECVQITEGRGLGSDHKPLILDVRIRQSAKAAP